MWKKAYILVFIFVSFLTAPTIVVLIDNHTDISFVYSTTEEEQTKNNISTEFTFNELKEKQFCESSLRKKSLIIHRGKQNLQTLYLEIISPPPDQV